MQSKVAFDPCHLLQGYTHPNHPMTDFQMIAIRLLRVICNSASVERLWSVFGNILTKQRSRTGLGTLTNIAKLKLYLREEHSRNKTARERVKRHFVAAKSAKSAEAATPAGTQTSDKLLLP